MIETVNTSRAAIKARQVLSALSLLHPCDMEIDDIAWARGALVREDKLSGAAGRLVKLQGKGIITIPNDLGSIGRRRFIVAHELGHFELHDNSDQLELCINNDLLYDYKSVRPDEKEANIFAMELLLPRELVKLRCEQAKVNFTFLKELASEFKVSRTLAAMRLMEYTSQRAALVISENGKIKWYRASQYFGYHFEPGSPVERGSCAFQLFNGVTGELSDSADAVAWLKSRKVDPNAFLREESFLMPAYNSVITLLWLDKDVELPEEESEQSFT